MHAYFTEATNEIYHSMCVCGRAFSGKTRRGVAMARAREKKHRAACPKVAEWLAAARATPR